MVKTATLSTREIEFQRLASEMSDLLNQYVDEPRLRVTAPCPLVLQQILRARRARADYFPDDLFADPAWDMLLDLYHARITDQRVTISGLCMAANVPMTTALRYIGILEHEKLVERHPDPDDGRRSFVRLTESARSSLVNFFAEHPVHAMM